MDEPKQNIRGMKSFLRTPKTLILSLDNKIFHLYVDEGISFSDKQSRMKSIYVYTH